MKSTIIINSYANGRRSIEKVYENALKFFFREWKLEYADDKREEYLVDSNEASLFAFASWLENTMGFTHDRYSIDTIDAKLDAGKMVYEEFLFSQLAMGKIERFSTELKDMGYDELFPLIKEWYARYTQDKKIYLTNGSEYDEMEEWIAEHVG